MGTALGKESFFPRLRLFEKELLCSSNIFFFEAFNMTLGQNTNVKKMLLDQYVAHYQMSVWYLQQKLFLLQGDVPPCCDYIAKYTIVYNLNGIIKKQF